MSRRFAPALALALALLAAGTAPAVEIGTSFTYQGRLVVSGVPANGQYDIRFELFDAASGGISVGSIIERFNTTVVDGLFSTSIDMGGAFNTGQERYLEIGVRPAGSGGGYTTLAGRVRLLAVPYAQYSRDADRLDGRHVSELSLFDHTHQLSALPGAVTDNQVPNDITVNLAQDSAQLDGLDSTAFSLSDHTHFALYGPPGSPYQSNMVAAATQTGTLVVAHTISAPDAEFPGQFTIQGGQAIGAGEEPGGNVIIKGGRGTDTATGGDGGSVILQGGDGDGDGPTAGGDIVLEPSNGRNGGPNGATYLNGSTIAANLALSGPVRDFNGSMGFDDQVLTTDGANVFWENPTITALSAPDGDPADALAADDDGSLVFTNGQAITSYATELRMEHNDNAIRFGTHSSTNLSILGGSSTVGGGVFRVEATAPSGIGNSGTALALKAGGGFQDGGNASLTAGNGGQGNAGSLALTAGSIISVGAAGAGGPVNIAAGNAYQGGGGDVTIEAGDSLFATGAATPGGDVFLNPGTGISGGADGKVIANGAFVANNANGVSITLDPSTAANPQVTFAAGTAASGKLTIAAPDAPLSNTDGRDIEVIAGDGVIAGVGNGGDVLIRAGNGAGLSGGVGGDGGSVTITAGNGDSDSNQQDGGSIVLTAGSGQGGGTAGIVQSASRLAVLRTTASHPIHVGTGASNGNGAHVTAGGMWTNGSDVNSKTAFEEVDPQAILAKVLALPVSRWQYQGEPEGVRHIGPMAQDFMEAFHLGESERHIGTVDADGVALAAIKGLHETTDERLQSLEAENAELRARLAAMEAAIARMTTTEGVAR